MITGAAERAGTVQPGDEKGSGDQINVHTYLQGKYREDGIRFLPVSSDRTRRKTETQKAVSEHKEHWQRFSRDIAVYPSLQIRKNSLDMVCSMALQFC